MHELSIAQSLVQMACDHAEMQGAKTVRRICVRLGVLSGMLRPLYFCFESSSRGSACEGAILEIEEVPLTVYCPRCDETKAPGSRYSFACPTCSTPTPKVITGREMQLVSIEVEKRAVGKVPPAGAVSTHASLE